MSRIRSGSRSILVIAVTIALGAVPAAADDRFDDLLVAVPGEDPSSAVEWIFGSAGGLTDLHSLLLTAADGEQLESMRALATGDFNGDLLSDIAIGMKYADLPVVNVAGRVAVCYGSGDPLAPFGGPCHWFAQDGLGPAAVPQHNDRFGAELAKGDFNADGYDDLAIGVPNDWVDGHQAAGSVHVLYGHPGGLGIQQRQYLRQGYGLADVAEPSDHLGNSLATADFNGDGYGDLVIGALGENGTGAVHVVYGGPAGLIEIGSAIWSQADLLGPPEAGHGDLFGYAVAGGDVNGDGFDDLAVTALNSDPTGGEDNFGMVGVVVGSASGLLPGNASVRLYQGTTLVGDELELQDNFGWDLEMGDFDSDGFDDLAIGVPHEGVGDIQTAGQVHVLYGSAGGFVVAETQIWRQGTDLWGAVEPSDLFGETLSSGDFDGDGFDDLAIGATGEDVGAVADAGAVSIVFGGPARLTGDGDQMWHQDALDLVGTCSPVDLFGAAIAAARSRGIFADGFELGSADAWEGDVRIWTCAPELYAAGDGCHCGCGAVDPDCADASSSSCDVCDAAGACSEFSGCAIVDSELNSVCW